MGAMFISDAVAVSGKLNEYSYSSERGLRGHEGILCELW